MSGGLQVCMQFAIQEPAIQWRVHAAVRLETSRSLPGSVCSQRTRATRRDGVMAGFGQTMAAARALADGLEWLVHMDSDEVLLPVTGALGLATVLSQQSEHVAALRFLNVEGQPEMGGITNRFEQITLFRTHQVRISPRMLFRGELCRLTGVSRIFVSGCHTPYT